MTREPVAGDELGARASALVQLARNSLGEMSERQQVAGLQALRQRLNRDRRSAWRTRSLVATACGAVAVAAVAGVVLRRNRSLSVRVESGALEAGGVVAAAPTSAPVLRFSDGSEVALHAGAHARVRSLDEHGAQVTLDDGDAHVYVVHAPETRWTFEAGPFVVAVTGTAFGLSWHEAARQLDLRLENGAVTVTGPPSDAPLTLRAGQWLTIRGGEVRIRALDAEGPSPAASTEVATGAPAAITGDPSTGEEPSPADTPATPAPARGAAVHDRATGSGGARRSLPERTERAPARWRAELAGGRFQSIVDEATAAGLDAAYEQSDAGDLAALADAARYTRHNEIARGALSAQRRRFAGSPYAQSAAFFLGRMAEADGDKRGALSWLDTYLAEAPSGTYAPEALGRKMTLVQELSGRAAARSLAETYLRRFPAGTYADAAHALLADGP